ncbi:unnamed protein product (macronuclear) [Paramecium tetraurelia]|uniref:MORN repeat protein n=1 Tax=Paramecium tetraurelia TaxID=5888 RepID=A0D944_PARTE|nr:uncharacterized protein GSPATT00014507001 [Paramecium tetraurelia]CAK79561.1 unnamed protein product [Paramecium tetraurelia]|eukprot:XP_001446958.1 hypothetical protein (macronuclear) [Paramecium tetraurelia strain d4-2]
MGKKLAGGIFGQLSQVYIKVINQIYQCKRNYIKFLRNVDSGGGSYDGENGFKNGKWIEISEGSCENELITHSGEYRNGKKIGRWETFYKEYYVNGFTFQAGGSYSEEGDGLKIGKWIELDENFSRFSQVIYKGEYQFGRKIGKWEIKSQMDQMQRIKHQKFRGGGQYDEEGQGLKIGKWIELSHDFSQDLQVFYKGEYHIGKKIGRWEIENERKQIGGGCYDEGSSGFKVGRWIELCEESKSDSLITIIGEYEKGKKIGRWDIWYQNYAKNKLIGGGLYDERGLNIKIGKWIELSDRFTQDQKVIYSGEYKNNMRSGRWDIWYQKDNEFQRIAGGQYQGDSIKIGKWIELSKGFRSNNQPSEQITYHGEYNNGKKVGIWVAMNLNCKKLKELNYNN